MKNNKVRLCKHCKSEMPAGAKVCPTCRGKQGGKLKYIVIVIAIIVVLGAIAGGNDDNSASAPSSQKAASDHKTQKAEQEKQINYKAVTVSQLEEDLQNNALSASDQYKDQYLEISGFLSNVDSDGSYIDLNSGEDDYSFISIQCYIKDDAQLDIIKTLSKGQALTVRGRCKDVGEVMGYSIDIIDIKE